MKNYVHSADTLNVIFSSDITSGQAVVYAGIPGVACSDATAGSAVAIKTSGVYRLSVYGHDDVSNKAIAVGDPVYIDSTNFALSADASKIPFGIALEPVAAGATTVIKVYIE